MMNFLNIIYEPAILIIICCFLFFLFILCSNYIKVKNNLNNIITNLQNISKKELSYKFNQLDEFMINNSYTSTIWEDFRKVLIFPDKLYIATHNANTLKDVNSDIYLTVDASYFFNAESLVTSKINHKFIQIMPTILTGLGPFFTFLKMAVAFVSVNFAANANIADNLSHLMVNIRLAALCSVFAVGFSLLFMIIDKLLYSSLCKNPCLAVQREFTRLFDVVTSEKFLIDLLKEAKIQGASNEKLIKTLPENMQKAIAGGLSDTIIPYLENMLYSLNKINENLNKGNSGDVVDKLF